MSIIIRIQNFHLLEGKYVVGTDPARYLRQAKLIDKMGSVPKLDLMRHHPLGVRGEEQTTVVSYVIFFMFRILKFFSPTISMETAAIIYPPVFFALSLIVLYLLISRLLCKDSALFCVVLLAPFPVVVGRTMTGFSDKDSLTLFLGLFSYYFYIRAYQTTCVKRSLLFSSVSGLIMALLGYTWHGVGLYISVIVSVEFSKFVLSEYKSLDVYRYSCWAIPMLITTISFKSIYHNLSQPFAFLVIVPPGTFLILVFIYESLMVFKFRFSSKITALSCTMAIFVLALVTTSLYKSIPHQLLDSFFSPLGTGRLQSTISELRKQSLIEWLSIHAIVFPFVWSGFLLVAKQFSSSLKLPSWTILLLFQFLLAGIYMSYLVSRIFHALGTVDYTVYGILIILSLSGLFAVFLYSYFSSSPEENIRRKFEQNLSFVLIWFIIMSFSSRGVERFEFYLAPVFISLAGYALVILFRYITGKTKLGNAVFIVSAIALCSELLVVNESLIRILQFEQKVPIVKHLILYATIGMSIFLLIKLFQEIYSIKITHLMLKYFALFIITIVLVFTTSLSPFPPASGYAQNSIRMVSNAGPFFDEAIRDALNWLKNNTPQGSVIAAWWDYGSWINLLSNRTTIIDEEQDPKEVHLMARHVMTGKSTLEAIEFLKSRNATHLLITGRDVAILGAISTVGSNETLDRKCRVEKLYFDSVVHDKGKISCAYVPRRPISADVPLLKGSSGKSHLTGVIFKRLLIGARESVDKKKDFHVSLEVDIHGKRESIRMEPHELYFQNRLVRFKNNAFPCTIVINSKERNLTKWEVLYLSEATRQTLIAELYILGLHSDYFTQIYPPKKQNFDDSSKMEVESHVKIWRINYP